MGVIAIEGIDVFAYHGVYAVEKEQGNRFLVDLYLTTDLSEAARLDELGATVDYQQVYEVVLEQMALRANLLETLVFRIGEALLAQFGQLESVKVRVRKQAPHAMPFCRESYTEQEFWQGERRERK